MARRYKDDFLEAKGKKWTQKANNREECPSVLKKVKIFLRLKSQGVRILFLQFSLFTEFHAGLLKCSS
jgi:hypothetical protein